MDTRNAYLTYDDYLQAERLASLREYAMIAAGFKCCRCSNTGVMHVHINGSVARGCETLRDATVWCTRCWTERERQRRRRPLPAIPTGTVITNDVINRLRTGNGGWRRDALAILGVSWPPRKGWKTAILGLPTPERAGHTFYV